MSVTLKLFQSFEINVGGEMKEGGSRVTPVELTLTNGYVYEVRTIVEDNYAEETLWTTGDGNIDTFDFLWLESDIDLLVEFADPTETEVFAINVDGGTPLVMVHDELLVSDAAATIITGNAITMKAIEQILAHNNGADAAGDATVRLVLMN